MTGTAPASTAAASRSDTAGLPQLLAHRARVWPDRVATRLKRLGYWHDVTWADYGIQAASVGIGLRSLGVRPGETVAILSGNRPEWLAADVGAQGVGAVTAGLHPASPPGEVARLLDHVDAVALIVEDALQLEIAREIRDGVPTLRGTVIIDTSGVTSLHEDTEMSFEELVALGGTNAPDTLREWSDGLDALTPDGPATIVFSAGSDPPRAVVLSHANLARTGTMLAEALGLGPTDELVSALPLSFVVERVVSCAAPLHTGLVVDFGGGPGTFTEDAREAQPTVFVTVPRTWEVMRDIIEARITRVDWLKRRVFRYWQRRGAARFARGAPMSRLGSRLLYKPLWSKFGLGRVRLALSVGAPIGAPVLEYLATLGMPVLESYGTVETTGFATCTPPGRPRVGSAGVALPGTEVRIADDGEILVRGPNVFLGYAGDRPGDVVDRDGWFHTGDTGSTDGDGYLTVTGRKKDLLVTATGTAVAPRFLEDRLKLSPYVREALLVGDGRPYLTALLDLADDAMASWAAEHRVPFTTRRDLGERPEVRELVDGILDEVNRDLAPAERIRDFRLLPAALDKASGALTPTERVRRDAVLSRYDGLVEDMYR